jgi:hypothetical protein
MLKEFCAAGALRSRQARLERGPRVRHRGIKGPPLCCEIKKEKIHAWSGGQRAGPAGGKNKRASVREEREQGDNGWDGFQVTQRWGPGACAGLG